MTEYIRRTSHPAPPAETPQRKKGWCPRQVSL
jgi:hypothetical protein